MHESLQHTSYPWPCPATHPSWASDKQRQKMSWHQQQSQCTLDRVCIPNGGYKKRRLVQHMINLPAGSFVCCLRTLSRICWYQNVCTLSTRRWPSSLHAQIFVLQTVTLYWGALYFTNPPAQVMPYQRGMWAPWQKPKSAKGASHRATNVMRRLRRLPECCQILSRMAFSWQFCAEEAKMCSA